METDNRETDKILTNLHIYIVASIVIFSVLLSKFFSSCFQFNQNVGVETEKCGVQK